MADEELKKAFQELQFKTNETRLRISQGDSQKKANLQKKAISEATSRALTELSSDYNYYRSIGRMFLLSTKDDELKRHGEEAAQYQSAADSIDKQREYLEKGLVEAEQNLREMVQSRRS